MIPYENPNMNRQDSKNLAEVNMRMRELTNFLYKTIEQMNEHEKQLVKLIEEKGANDGK